MVIGLFILGVFSQLASLATDGYDLVALAEEGPYEFDTNGGKYIVQIGKPLPRNDSSDSCNVETCTVQKFSSDNCSCFGDVSNTIVSELSGEIDGFELNASSIVTTQKSSIRVYCADSLDIKFIEASVPSFEIHSTHGCKVGAADEDGEEEEEGSGGTEEEGNTEEETEGTTEEETEGTTEEETQEEEETPETQEEEEGGGSEEEEGGGGEEEEGGSEGEDEGEEEEEGENGENEEEEEEEEEGGSGPPPKTKKKNYTWAIIVGAVGGTVLIVIIIIIIVCVAKSSKKSKGGEHEALLK